MKLIPLIQIVLYVGMCMGQTPQQGDYSADRGSSRQKSSSVKFVAQVTPRDDIPNLDVLVRASPLILDGTVVSSLPSVNRIPGRPMVVETHSYVEVNEVLKGSLAPDVHRILLCEEGGKAAGIETEVDGNPLVIAGERYILFLEPDTWTKPEQATSPLRYFTVGVWAGKAKVENNAVQFLPKSGKLLHDYDGMAMAAFVADVRDLVNFRVKGSKRTVPFPGLPAAH